MRILIQVLLCLFGPKLLAADGVSRCVVNSDTLTDHTDYSKLERYLLLKYRSQGTVGYFDSLQFVVRDPETGTEKVQDLFTSSKRGGYETVFCADREREYLKPVESFTWYSDCTGVGPITKVVANAYLSKRRDGKVSIRVIRGGLSEKRVLTSLACD